MSKIKKRDTATRDGTSAEQRLARLLDTPHLARVVPHLSPETLHQLIRYRGLEACGEIVISATPAQLASLLDLDLWRHARLGRPGGPAGNERFDADRFGEWLEVLVDTDHAMAARTVATLDQNLVVAGLSRYVRVFDPGIFEPTAQSDDEPTDRHEAMREGDWAGVNEATDADSMPADAAPAHESSAWLECEVGGYLIRAQRSDTWDAIVTLLVALDAEHGNYFHAVMQGCRRLSNSRSEVDGLDDLLIAPEQHLHEVTIDREHRRSRQGYATPADARAFLEMARQPARTRSGASNTASSTVNPIVAAYFRAADEAPESPDETARSPHTTEVPESLDAVMALLTEVGVMPERPRALLEGPSAEPEDANLARLRRLMACVRDTHETAYVTRSRELAFLANTLLAGGSVQSRPFTLQEASQAAAAICNLGLEYWPARWPGVTAPAVSSLGQPHPHDTLPPDSWLIEHDLVTAFEVGWSVLHRDVSLFATEQLISILAHVDCVDPDINRELVALRRTLVKQRDAGTPWQARGAAEVLAMLDMTAWISVLGLLDECPVLPAALTAVLEGRTTAISPTEFAFISTAAQIGDVRRFMRKLPDVLSR